MTWQCRRSADLCGRLRDAGLAGTSRPATGLPLTPASRPERRWLLDDLPDGRGGRQRAGSVPGTVDSWLLWNLTGGRAHRSDISNASRTQLLDLGSGTWDESLCEAFGVPRRVLPEIVPLERRRRRDGAHR